MKSYYPKEGSFERKWRVIDLNGKTLGRAATQIATILRGKDKPIYSPSVDTGDFVVAINASGIKLTGNKLEDKIYYRHTGFFGGMKSITAKKQLQKDASEVILSAVKGMLPRGPLGRKQLKKLKVYSGGEHPHSAQKPEAKQV